MGIDRKLRRAALRREYAKFARRWKDEKAARIATNELATVTGEKQVRELGLRPPFDAWSRIIASDIRRAKDATPEDVVEHAEENDMGWEDDG